MKLLVDEIEVGKMAVVVQFRADGIAQIASELEPIGERNRRAIVILSPSVVRIVYYQINDTCYWVRHLSVIHRVQMPKAERQRHVFRLKVAERS